MFSLAISYKISARFEAVEMSVPEIEDYLANYIAEFIFDADMINVEQHNGKSFPDFSGLSDFQHPSVFVEFILPANISLFEDFITNDDAITNYIMESLTRESIYLESFWNEK